MDLRHVILSPNPSPTGRRSRFGWGEPWRRLTRWPSRCLTLWRERRPSRRLVIGVGLVAVALTVALTVALWMKPVPVPHVEPEPEPQLVPAPLVETVPGREAIWVDLTHDVRTTWRQGSLRVALLSWVPETRLRGRMVDVQQVTGGELLDGPQQFAVDGEGMLSLGGLPEGEYQVSMARNPDVFKRLRIEAGRTAAVELPANRGTDLVGIVRDNWGRPVEGAEIYLQVPGRRPLAVAESDGEGRYRVTAVRERGRVKADHGDFALGRYVEFEGRSRGEVEVNPSVSSLHGELEVRVRDTQGEVVVGASIDAVIMCPSGAEVIEDVDCDPLRAVSGTVGEIVLLRLPPGLVRLRIRAPGFVPFEHTIRIIDDYRIRRSVELQLGASFEGVVLGPRGQAIGGAEIALVWPDLPRRMTGRSSVRGAFRFVELPRGNVRVRVRAPGFEEVDFALPMSPGAKVVREVELLPGATLALQVHDVSGLGVPDAKIVVRGRTDAGGPWENRVFTDSFGGARIHTGSHGILDVTVTKSGFQRRVLRLAGASSAAEIEMPYLGAATGRITGEVVAGTEDAETGIPPPPVAGAAVTVWCLESGEKWTHSTDGAGMFDVTGLSPGTYGLRVTASSRPRFEVAMVRVGENEVRRLGQIVLEEPCRVRFVRQPADVPPETRIEVRGLEGPLLASARLDAGVDPTLLLAPGGYRLRVVGPGVVQREQRIEVPRPVRGAVIKVLVESACPCVFRITPPVGACLVRVEVGRNGSEAAYRLELRPEVGRREFTARMGLAPGAYTLRAIADDGEEEQRLFAVPKRSEPLSVALRIRAPMKSGNR